MNDKHGIALSDSAGPALPAPVVVQRFAMWHARHIALRAGLALLGVGAILTIMMIVTRPQVATQGIDNAWASAMESIRTPWLTRGAEVFNFLGGSRGTIPIRFAVIVVLVARRRWLQLAAFVGAIATAELCIGPLKALVDRPRPVGGLVGHSGSSFPSGHALAGAVTAFGLVVALLRPGPRRYGWIAGAAVFAALMALSRPYLGVHWLTDVVAGGCLGIGWALVWPAALEIMRDRRAHRVIVADEIIPPSGDAPNLTVESR